jgi:hypothetical protein
VSRLYEDILIKHKRQFRKEHIDTSLLLQSISGGYINILHKLYHMWGRPNLTIMWEQVNVNALYSITISVNKLIPVAGAKNNVYYNRIFGELSK